MSSVDEGCRRRKKETGRIVSSLARTLASFLVGRIRKDTQRSHRLYLPKRLTARSVSGGPSATVATPPSPPLPHSVTLELSVEGHTTCLYTQAQAHVYACTHARTSVYDARKRKRKRTHKGRARGREREASRAPWEPRKTFPAYHPLRPLRASSLDSLSLSLILSSPSSPPITARASSHGSSTHTI